MVSDRYTHSVSACVMPNEPCSHYSVIFEFKVVYVYTVFILSYALIFYFFTSENVCLKCCKCGRRTVFFFVFFLSEQ